MTTKPQSLVEVNVWRCRFCGRPVQKRAQHEERCSFNPVNINKRKDYQRKTGEPKKPISLNMTKDHVARLKKFVELGEVESQSMFVRAVLNYVFSDTTILEKIMEKIKNGEY